VFGNYRQRSFSIMKESKDEAEDAVCGIWGKDYGSTN
jgi:hypothetical protein